MSTGGSLTLAWALTGAASASTFLGALVAIVLSTRGHGEAPPKALLAASLAAAGGLMLFVAVVELPGKAMDAFLTAGYDEATARILAYSAFFGGAVLSAALNWTSHMVCAHRACGGGGSPAGEVASTMAAGHQHHVDVHVHGPAGAGAHDVPSQGEPGAKPPQLLVSGVQTTLAICLHNFPEGLATFLAALASGRSGAAIALGVILHNIPEGFAVAVPVYAGSLSKAKALSLAGLAGLSELSGGVMAFALSAAASSRGDEGGGPGGAFMGVLFGMVNGIVVMLVVLDFIPTAYEHDAHRKVVPAAFLLGMGLIAITLAFE